MTSVVSDLREAFTRHQAGDLPQAERLYRAVLEDEPTHAEALHLLGVLAHQTGQSAAAIDLIGRAIRHAEAPRAMMYCNLGAAHQALGEFDQAIQYYRRAVEFEPGYVDAQHNLATAFAGQGDHQQAIGAYQHLLAAHSGHRAARMNLGKSLQSLGRFDDAAACYRGVLENHPGDIEALLSLGTAHALQGESGIAAERFEELVRLAPHHPQGHFNLGRIRQDQNRLDEAVTHYRRAVQYDPAYVDAWNNLGVALKSLKRFDEAATCFQRIVDLAPDSAIAHFNLGNVRRAQDRHPEAIECYRRALRIAPEHLESYLNLGTALTAVGKFPSAENTYRTALEVCPQSIEAHLNLASALQLQGRLAEAAAIYDRATLIDPACEAVQSNALMLPLYRPEISRDEIFRRHRQWGDRFAPGDAPTAPLPNDPNPERRLRIGYFSPDFRVHPVGFFMESILRHHDRRCFEVTCYAEHAEDDRMTKCLRPLADNWRTTFRRTDEDVVQMIREDGIDILIDLAGHTSGNRLPVFARRPAPIQMTYLGYGTTTGLPTMDYRLTDAVADPPGEPVRHTEELARIPAGILCYTPPPDAPDVTTTPALQNGHVTFGSFNNLSKLSESTLDVWADVLRAIPGSRLILKNRSFSDSAVRTRFTEKFAARNVPAERIELLGPTASIVEHLSLYGRVDLALDPFPYNGATTTCESLWMGVPAITLRGNTFVGRMTASLLTTVGLPEFIAESAAEYVDIARGWSTAFQQLADLRRKLRTIMGESRLCDEPAYVQELQNIYKTVWRRWCTAARTP